MSMRHWNPRSNGHDHFFATFGKFGPPSDKTGDMLAEVAARAAAERVSYLELMLTPNGAGATRAGGRQAGTPDFGRLRDRLLADGFQEVVAEARRRIDVAEARQRELLRCGATDADAGCQVTIRYISQVGQGGGARAGVRAAARGLRDGDAGSALRRRQPGAAGRRSDRGARFLAADVDDRFPARQVSAACRSRCTPASWSKGWCRRKRSASTSANRSGPGTRAASGTAAASCTRTTRWGCCARWRRSGCSSRSRSAATT